MNLSVSMKLGLWNGSSYDNSRLKMINLPVLKRHNSAWGTISMKNYLGFITNADPAGVRWVNPSARHCWTMGPMDNGDPCTTYTREYGLAARQMVRIRRADLNIVDAIWVNPRDNAGYYEYATRQDVLLASRDPFAVDYYASEYVLYPLVAGLGIFPNPEHSRMSYHGGWLRNGEKYNVARLRALGVTNTINIDDALTRDQELAQFNAFVIDLAGSPTPTPSRTPTRTATAVPATATRTPTRTATALPATATRTPTRTATAAPATTTATRTPTRTATIVPATATRTRTATSLPVTPTRTNTSTSTPPPSPTPTPTATLAGDLIFRDGFESGDLSAWSANYSDGGDLSVTTDATIYGSFGLQALLDDNNAIYVTDDSPDAEKRYRTRLYFDPNSIAMLEGDAHQIFYAHYGASTPVLRIEFGFSQGSYRLRASLRTDANTGLDTPWVNISDEPHCIEIDWRAASAPNANNGGLSFWIDGTLQSDLTGVDNDLVQIDRVQIGALYGMDNGTRGVYYFDAFESRRVSYIGQEFLQPGFEVFLPIVTR
jgi:hypothetical protein